MKMSRKCVNNPDNFCYICREVRFASRKCLITPTIKKAYYLYFSCKVGDQDKKLTPHVCCTVCYPISMRGWMEKDVVCHLECPWFEGCLAMTVLTVISVWCPLFKMVCPWRKNQHLCIRIYQQQFSLCDGLPVPEPLGNFAIYSDDEDSVSSNSEEQQPSASRDADYLPSTDSSNHKITEGD